MNEVPRSLNAKPYQTNELALAVLSDSEPSAAKAFGLAFTLAPELQQLYAQMGNDLPQVNGNGQWVLPVPATYLIGTDGRIA